MEANTYQRLAERTINQFLTVDEKREHALYGMASEVGEVLGIYQKTFQGHSLNVDKVKDELGDLMWFISELCTVIGISINDVMEHNIEKLLERYPDGFDCDKSINRKEYTNGNN